jgi:hypothetical protein
VKLLVEHKANLDLAAQNGWTALFYCCAEDQRDCAQFLVDSGASVKLVANDGRTLLDLGEGGAQADILKIISSGLTLGDLDNLRKAAAKLDLLSRKHGVSSSKHKLAGKSGVRKRTMTTTKEHAATNSQQRRASQEVGVDVRITSNALREILPLVAANDAAITTVDLWGEEIGDVGAIQLAKALEQNTVVTAVILQKNKIGNRGTAALARMLMKNSALVTLQLANNDISDSGVKQLGRALCENQALAELSIMHNSKVSAVGLKVFVKLLQGNSALLLLQAPIAESSPLHKELQQRLDMNKSRLE